MTLSADASRRNFTLGQAGSAHDLRLRTTGTSDNGTPSVPTPAGAFTADLAHVVYTRNSAGEARIFIDGRPIAGGRASGDFSTCNDGFRLALGNELSRDRPWVGELRLVVIYDRALSDGEIAGNYLAGMGLLAAAAR